MLFIETSVFTRLVTATLNDADYAALQQSLADRPDAGRLIEGGAGIRKVRWALHGTGKRGGLRVIYYWPALPVFKECQGGSDTGADQATR